MKNVIGEQKKLQKNARVKEKQRICQPSDCQWVPDTNLKNKINAKNSERNSRDNANDRKYSYCYAKCNSAAGMMLCLNVVVHAVMG